MKSFTKEEFVKYVETLQFEELEDAANFVNEYYEYYRSLSGNNKEEKDSAWEKYMILQAKFGMLFVSFTKMVIEFRKNLNDEIAKSETFENPSATALENRTE